jgi:hypothetical protein
LREFELISKKEYPSTRAIKNVAGIPNEFKKSEKQPGSSANLTDTSN